MAPGARRPVSARAEQGTILVHEGNRGRELATTPGHVSRLCQSLGNVISGALLSPAAAVQWPVCPEGGCTERAGIAGLRDPGSEQPKAPRGAPDPRNVVWPILAAPDGGKSVVCSGSVTWLPKPYPSLHPPAPTRNRAMAARKSPWLPWPRRMAPRSPCPALRVYFTSSRRQIRARAGSFFYFS